MFSNWISDVVRRTIKEITLDTENKFEKMHSKFRTIESLEQEISKLKIDRSVIEEVTHKLGLERMRQEQDAKNNKKEMELSMREGNISAEEKRFKDQMEFERNQLEEQIKSLNVLVEKVFEKLPQVTHNTHVEVKEIKRFGRGKLWERV
jgi:homoaconitase/3-isopropylmalate dehydratase large subunit